MIKHKNQRLFGLDIFRGLAVILMIVYHFFFDLHYFGYLQIDFFTPFWLSFRYLIISFFLFSMGISLVLSHLLKIHLNKVMRRIIVLGISALSVSIASYYLFPNSWIYFGILHFIWLASILVLPLLFHPKTAIVFAVLIFSAYFLGFDDNIWLSILQTMLSLPQQTQDFVPIFSVVISGFIRACPSSFRLASANIFPANMLATSLATAKLSIFRQTRFVSIFNPSTYIICHILPYHLILEARPLKIFR